MKWELDGKYAMRSGAYLITKNATGKGWVYLCFKSKELIGRATDETEAKAICERDRAS